VRHSLSYTHADQVLLRDVVLDQCWDGLVVPGTLATFYFRGTGGFVLTLPKPYLLDPRTPLLQTIEIQRPAPKASHLELAKIHDPEVVATWPDVEIQRAHWEDGRWLAVVRRVLEFQTTYSTSATQKIDKYNDLLLEAGRQPMIGAATPPVHLIPPYWAVSGRADPWWVLTREAVAIALADHPGQIMPIVTLRSGASLELFAELIDDLPEGCGHLYCWASDWNEADATEEDVEGWYGAIMAGAQRGISVRNLYGGYLSVLMTAKGLAGINHGIGYSESRDSDRLSATGAPPTRYYLSALREFFSVPSAQPVIDHLPAEWACDCDVCARVADEYGRPQIGRLSTQQLKRHFLIARHREFLRVDAGLAPELANLREVGQWVAEHERRFLPARHGERLLGWADAVERL
jgi:hypothetical protein